MSLFPFERMENDNNSVPYYMKRNFDVFFSFSKMTLDGSVPADVMLYENLFEQIRVADQLGFKKAWVGEAHFSIRPEQTKENPLLPHFNGELCINTDILQIASVVYPKTQNIEVGSAIRNILVNGGPVAHAEGIRNFLTIHNRTLKESNRKLNIGFGVGRFAYANAVYGVKPRNELEKILWPVLKGKILKEAAEIFVRLLTGELLSSRDIPPKIIERESFDETTWAKIQEICPSQNKIEIPSFWEFEPIKIIPEEIDLSQLDLIIGTHDPLLQQYINQFHPVKVFNLSVTPNNVIDATHDQMQKAFHKKGGVWKREYMPRTLMVFTNGDANISPERQSELATEEAREAIISYWKAMEGTVDEKKVREGMENAVYGNPAEVYQQISNRFHKNDRIMAWFDFNTNDKNIVIRRMKDFMLLVAPKFDIE